MITCSSFLLATLAMVATVDAFGVNKPFAPGIRRGDFGLNPKSTTPSAHYPFKKSSGLAKKNAASKSKGLALALDEEGQKNMKEGWKWMTGYWTIGALVGAKFGYFTRILERAPKSMVNPWYALAFVGTAICARMFNTRNTNFGRKFEFRTSVVFSLANGLAESTLFLASYDLGRKVLGNYFGMTRAGGIVTGFSTYSIYSTLIHLLFWLPKGFPPHVKPTAPKFERQGLPIVVFMSMIWFAIYESFADPGFFCLLHTFFDWQGAVVMAMPGPWSEAEPLQEATA